MPRCRYPSVDQNARPWYVQPMGPGNDWARSPLSLVGQDEEAAFYARHLGRSGGPALVLGCGSGQIPWELAGQGVEAVGVDPSPMLIAAAEERRASGPTDTSGRLKFLSADLRSLRLSRRFSVVVAPHNALGLMGSLEDLEALLATARYHLAPDGVLVFDVVNAVVQSATSAVNSDHPEAPLLQRQTVGRPFAPHLRERRRSGLTQSASIRRLHLRQLNVDQVESAICEAGFVPQEKYGRYDGKPFEPSDPIQIVVAGLG